MLVGADVIICFGGSVCDYMCVTVWCGVLGMWRFGCVGVKVVVFVGWGDIVRCGFVSLMWCSVVR